MIQTFYVRAIFYYPKKGFFLQKLLQKKIILASFDSNNVLRVDTRCDKQQCVLVQVVQPMHLKKVTIFVLMISFSLVDEDSWCCYIHRISPIAGRSVGYKKLNCINLHYSDFLLQYLPWDQGHLVQSVKNTHL